MEADRVGEKAWTGKLK